MTDTPTPDNTSEAMDLTAPEQVEKSIGMCRLHGLHNTEATLRALAAKLVEAETTLADGSFYQEKDIDALQADRETLYKSGIAEIAARNPNVMEYMKHWESRAEAAGAERDAALGALLEIDALDPESKVDGCSHAALRGLVLRMGEIARDARQKGGE